ncbi:GlxA family transcriptional regulator [Streptomyces sp. JNUCC 64]
MTVITVLLADGVPGHQLGVPGAVFGAANRADLAARYEVRACSATGTVTTADPPLTVATPWGPDALADASTVLVTSPGDHLAPPPPGVTAALRAAADRGARMAAIGTGTFVLAAAGLLDGRRATTSWPHLGELADRHPGITVEPVGDPTVADPPFHTAPGVFGGLDLCVELVALDHGVRTAAQTMRRLVLPVREQLVADEEERERELARHTDLALTLRWLADRLDRPLTLADLAAHARISVSTLTRRFRAQTGLPPLRYLLRARLHEAQSLLENTDLPVERVAARTGFGSPANLRHHFHRLTGVSPRAYRAAFRTMTATVAAREPEAQVAREPGAPDGPRPPDGPER